MKKLFNKNKKILFIWIGCSIFLIGLLLSVYYFIFKPQITLLGDEIIYVTINNQYSEPGVKAHNLKDDLTGKVNIIGEVNPNKLGTYHLTYKVTSNFLNTKVVRTVKVIDDIKPVINLQGDLDVIICPNIDYVESGYEAIDNVDGDITDKVTVTKEEDKIIYKVKDAADNETVVTRNIIGDNQNPTISLYGYATMNLIIGTRYYESGYSASDNCDGNLTNKVQITNNVDVNKLGTYYVKYTVSDSFGNTNEIIRTVKIINPPVPKNSTIYLTFDDGPSGITPQVLDILREENIKATFFVLNTSSGYNYLLKRIVDEGHTIGLHSNTHNYNQIYTSVDAYFYDLNLIHQKVLDITGVDSKIIRFPGGSSNIVSSFNPGIMTVLTNEVTARGYLYYDWNVSSSDTSSSCYDSSCVYNSVIKGLNNNSTLIVLLHDFGGNYKTLNALRDIIRYGKNNGYNFDRITENTPQVKHRINN